MSIRKVVVAVSGGVDSAVSAYILKTRGKRNMNILYMNRIEYSNFSPTGYEVQGVFMKNWDLVDENGHCSSDEDWKYAQTVCKKLNIPLLLVNFVKEYWNNVFK